MKCPYCGEENTKVIDSRPAEENNAIRRRRQCEKCKKMHKNIMANDDDMDMIIEISKM